MKLAAERALTMYLLLFSVNAVKMDVEEIRDEINRKTGNYPSSYELNSLQNNVNNFDCHTIKKLMTDLIPHGLVQ